MEAGWYICNKGRIYLPKAWVSEEEATKEMDLLLEGYPPKHPWRKLLSVHYRTTSPRKSGVPINQNKQEEQT